MILGILRETKQGESRVICTPQEVAAITAAGHTVYAQRGCGARAGFPDEAYEAAGALLATAAQEVFAVCDMVAKVKEFTPEEWPLIRKGQLLLGCLHPAANPAEVDALLPDGPGRVVVQGTDADLPAVVLRLLRKNRIADLAVGYVPVAASAATELWGLPVGEEAVEIAFAGR